MADGKKCSWFQANVTDDLSPLSAHPTAKSLLASPELRSQLFPLQIWEHQEQGVTA